jgi:methyl-accepting chemotaxis protein
MTIANLKSRFQKLRTTAGERVETLSAASTGWRMNRKVGLTFGAIAVTMATLALVTVGSLFIVRSSVGGVTDLSQANQALLRVQTQAVAAQGQLKDYVIRPDEKLATQVKQTLDEALDSLDDAEDGAEAIGESKSLESVRKALEATRASADRIVVAQQTISQQVDKELVVRGPAIAATLKSITEQAHSSGDADATYSAGVAQARYLEMRINVTRYLSDASPATAKMAKDNLLDLEDSMNVLFEELEGSSLSGATDKVIVEFVAYDKAFDRVIAATRIRNQEVDRTLRVTGPTLAENANRIVRAIEGKQGRATLTAQAASLSAVLIALLASAAGIAVALFAGVLTQRLIARPIMQMAERMRSLAAGDRGIEITETHRTDEVGDMARAVEIFRANAHEVDERRAAALEAERRELDRDQALAREREAERANIEAERRQAMLALADGFEASVRHVVESVSASAKQIEGGARLVSETAEQSGQLTAGVATTASQASENSMVVASATEEMSISIAEVSQQISGAAKVAQEASERARSTDAIVGNLIADTKTIEDVVALIADVARQTNLLALNATIEASRAGDAGRGFAVVASEIKTLAGRTASATQEISSKIARARETTGLAASAITDIARTIDEISEIATVVACAMEQQRTTTAQIAESTSQAAHGSQDVAHNIGRVHEGVGATGKAATDALHAADDLNQQAETLKQAVDSFLSTVRAA